MGAVLKKKVEVLYFDGCPNGRETLERAREILRDLDVAAEVEEVEVKDLEDAQRLRFLGSPSVRVDGLDIEVAARASTAYAFACRTYSGSGVPPRELFVEALGGGRTPQEEDSMQPASIEVLRRQFNAALDAVRVVTLISPTCLVCQYGAGVVRTVFELTASPSLKGFAVWVPMMGADTLEEARREAAAFTDGRIAHLWDGERYVGDAFTKTLGLAGTAWDVYLLYPGGVRWDGALPPEPAYWMHQLPSATAASAERLLVPRAFAGQARVLLGGSAAEVTTDMALLLHAKGLSTVRSLRPPQSLEDIGAKAVGQYLRRGWSIPVY